MKKFKTFAFSILIPVIAGGIVGFIISKFIDYNSLQKPALAPPSGLFPVVWTILYVLMGVSFGILATNGKDDGEAKLIYYAQLIVNLIWPIFFFVLKWRFISLIWIALLSVLVIIMTIKFYQRNKLAGLLQIPYILWTLFATYLNWGVYTLNG